VIFLGVGNESEFFTLQLMGISFSTRIFALRTIFIEVIMFVNRGMGITYLEENSLFSKTISQFYFISVQGHSMYFYLLHKHTKGP
jgi:hypothetical protein